MDRSIIIYAAALALGGWARGDAVVSATGSFNAMPASFWSSTATWVNGWTQPATTTSIFWNNPSDDSGTGGSHLMNIGNLVTGTGGFVGMGSPTDDDMATAQFTNAGGGDPAAFNFVSAAIAQTVSLIFSDSSCNTGNSRGTTFGYYVGNTYIPLFDPTDSMMPSVTVPFDPTSAGGDYGFFATVCYGPGECETYTTGNGNFGNVSGGAGWNHFALFQLASGNYVIGFEDSDGLSGEYMGDFNDVVVEIQKAPEPSTFAVMAVGLAMLIQLGGLAQGRRGSHGERASSWRVTLRLRTMQRYLRKQAGL